MKAKPETHDMELVRRLRKAYPKAASDEARLELLRQDVEAWGNIGLKLDERAPVSLKTMQRWKRGGAKSPIVRALPNLILTGRILGWFE